MSSTVLAICLLSTTFEFKGGNDLELTRAFAESLHQPAAILCYERFPKHKANTFSFKNTEDFRAKAKNILSLSSGIGAQFGFSKGRWPRGMFYENKRFEYLSKFQEFGEN